MSDELDLTDEQFDALEAGLEKRLARRKKVPSVKRSPFLHRGDFDKSLDNYNTKDGFTGKKPDKLGRDQCYANGVHVPCGQEQTKAPEQSKPERTTVSKPEVPTSQIGSFTKPLEDSTVRDSNTNPSIKDLGPEFTE